LHFNYKEMIILKTLGSLLLIFVLAILFTGAILPHNDKIEFSKEGNFNSQCVIDQINDLKKWDKWSAWHHMDPNMKISYGAITSGKGASYSWDGNSKVGKGVLTIMSADENSIDIEINVDGNIGKSHIEANETKLIWSMDIEKSENNIVEFFFGGYKYILFNFMMKKDLTTNLENLAIACK
jgi:hypothetical protein